MVSLRWGDVLSILLPGALSLLGLRFLVPAIGWLLDDPNRLTFSGGLFLMLIAAIAGGVIEAARRVAFEWRHARRTDKRSIFYYLNAENLAIFEAGVENSYRYYTFFSNLSLSILFVVGMRWLSQGLMGIPEVGLLACAAILFAAARIQLRFYTTFVRDFEAAQKDRLAKEKTAMLDNWPPPGTEIVTAREIVVGAETIPAGTRGVLAGTIAERGPEQPSDKFVAKLLDRKVTVTRQDIVLAMAAESGGA